MKRLAVGVVLLFAVVGAPGAQAQLSGRASVTDGDSLRLAGRQVRLHGIDAPESRQTCVANGKRWRCGAAATRALSRRIAGRSVTCQQKDRDRYGRVVAVCGVGGRDINRWMVRQGWALAYRRYSRVYVGEEKAARAARRGLWRGQFVPPWKWRRGERLGGAVSKAREEVRGACRIKGNLSRKGTRIYHVPGGQYYDRTRIDTTRGERWFCSEAAARNAGWRRSRR